MRILVLTPTFLPMVGGAELLLLEVFRRLATHHEVVLLTPDKGLPPSDHDKHINFEVVRYKDRVSFMNFKGHRLTGGIIPPFSLSAVQAVSQSIKHFAPDVLNVHFMKHVGLAAVVAQRQKLIPTVLSVVGSDIPGHRTPFLWRYYYRWVIKQLASVTFVSAHCQQAIYREKNLPIPKHIIYNGVNFDRFSLSIDKSDWKKRLGLEAYTPILLAVQRLDSIKRVDVLIRAASQILLSYPGMKLIIVGDGPERIKLEALVDRLNLKEAIRFEGYVGRDALPYYYGICDLFIFHSLAETFGIVLAEAMAAKKAVVSVKNSAIPEVVQHNQTGLLVPPQDPIAFAEAVIALLSDPERREQMGKRGREYALAHFDWDVIAAQYESVFESVTK
jgi:glycosyltransferase involved in cell wall biosynthesis